jgi:hypothetical protein
MSPEPPLTSCSMLPSRWFSLLARQQTHESRFNGDVLHGQVIDCAYGIVKTFHNIIMNHHIVSCSTELPVRDSFNGAHTISIAASRVVI